MKVYIVVGNDYGGTEIGEVFLDKQLAEDIAAEKNKFKGIYDKYMEYGVIEKEVLNERLITKKDKLTTRIEGHIHFNKRSELKGICCGVAEDWCKNCFYDVDTFISAEIFVKAEEVDFDLTQEELKQKYLSVWEEICDYANQLNKEEMPIEDIAEKLEEKYRVEW